MFCILALRYDTIRYDSSVLQLKLLLRAYRKSYMRNRLIPKWMTLTFVQRSYQGRVNHSHTTAALRQLHWLSVAYRVQYNICILMQSIVKGTAPGYLRELVQPTSQVDSRPNLRSSDNCSFFKLRTRTKFAERAFCISGPAGWNALPTELRLVQCKDIPSSDVLKTLF